MSLIFHKYLHNEPNPDSLRSSTEINSKALKLIAIINPIWTWYLSPEASERLVLNLSIVGYPLKNFLRYITCL